MGYSTDFQGELEFTTPLSKEQTAYIQAFNQTRRMKRNAEIAATFKDELREAAGLPIGEEGAYYVGSVIDNNFGQKEDSSITDYNSSAGQPSLWCQWTVSDEGTCLMWDEGEKFYNYVEWLQYLITHFFNKWNTQLNGTIRWRGEDFDDMGKIIVENSIITVKETN